jgi:hypothetical protein
MKEAESNSRLVGLVTVLTAILVVLAGLNVARLWRISSDAPGHNALWLEINKQLKDREATGEFPASLDELALTDPDNGSAELLKLIDYRREGTGCRVSTTLRGKKLERQYRDQAGESPSTPQVND